MSGTVEKLSIADHQGDIRKECSGLLVLVPFRFVLHVFECDRAADQVAVVWHLLPRRLIMEEIGAFPTEEAVDDAHEDVVQGLRAVLLLAAPALVCSQVLVLKVIVAEAMLLELLSRRLVLAAAAVAFERALPGHGHLGRLRL